MTLEALLPWLFYLIAVAGAAAVYCLLPRGGSRRTVPSRLAALGSVLGAAALAGLIAWSVLFQRTRIYTWSLDREWRPHLAVENPVQGWFFYLFAAIAIGSAVAVIVHPRPIYSALYFVLTVLAVGGALLMLQAEFLAVALVLIYAGAILVTYVFVIMLARESPGPGPGDVGGYDVRSRQPLAGVLAGFLLLAAIVTPMCDRANWYNGIEKLAFQAEVEPPDGSPDAMGRELYQSHVLGIELAGVLLVVAIVGAVAVARKRIEAAEAAGPVRPPPLPAGPPPAGGGPQR